MTNQSTSAFSFASSTNVFQLASSREKILINENVSVWSDSVKRRLEELIKLPTGWDGYQGVHVSFENANFAYRVLDAICRPETHAPQIVPGTAGDLQLEWHTQQGDIELHVKGPNRVHAWRAMTEGNADGEEMDLTNDFAVVAQWVKEIMEPPIVASAAA